MADQSKKHEILYEQEVMAYLRDFVYPQIKAPSHTPPQSLEQVIEDVDGIWEELDGFMKPLALRKSLLGDYLSDEREDDIIQMVDVLGRMRYDNRDPMTQYMRKTELGIMTGLAHLYATMNDEPCAIIELDFSNMGGTNRFFQQLLADAQNVNFEDIDPKEAEALTDNAAKVIAQIVLKEVRQVQNDHSVIMPIRAGGDELRIICTDISPKLFQELKTRIHHEIELSVARMGLLDHEHSKHIGNDHKNGFGAAIAISDLRDASPETYMETADAKIDAAKKVMGYIRLGRDVPENLTLEGPFNGESKSKERVMFRHKALRKAMNMAGTGSDVSNAAQRLQNIKSEMTQLLWHTDYSDEATYQSSLFNEDESPFDFADGDFNAGLLYMSVAEEYEWKLVQHLKEEGLDTDDYELEMLHNSLMGLTPLDPATDVWMPRDMPRQLEIYVRDLKAHMPHLHTQLVEESQNSATIKAGPLHEGLRKAHKLPQELEHMSPMMMGVAFHNLAGLNKVFGHDNANKALRHMAQDILKNTLHEHGLNDEDYAIAHEGGGSFTVIFKPVIQGQDGFVTILGQPLIDSIGRQLEHHINLVNEDSIAAFMTSLDMQLLDDGKIAEMGLETMKDIPDQKQRTWMNGLSVSSVARNFDMDAYDVGEIRMGLHLHQLRVGLENKVEADRALREGLHIYKETKMKPAVKP